MIFQSFKIKELFDIHPTKSYNLTNSQLFCNDGKVPVVTNTSENYGRSGFSNLKPTEHDIITFSDKVIEKIVISDVVKYKDSLNTASDITSD